MPVRGITFDLSSQAIAHGVQSRASAHIAADTMKQMRTKPLLAAPCTHEECACAPRPRSGTPSPISFALPSASTAAAAQQQQQQLSKANMRFVPAPQPPSQPPHAMTSSPLTGFTFGSLVATPALHTVDFALTTLTNFAPTPLANMAVNARARIGVPIAPSIEASDHDEIKCVYVDQYSVGDPAHRRSGCSRFAELVYAVVWHNEPYDVTDEHGRPKVFSTIIGKKGHYERFAASSHIFGFLVFAIYAIVRSIIPIASNVSGVLATVAAWTVAFVFLASTLYHCTSPDIHFAMVTRVLDYLAIYIGVVVGAVADLSIATNGFDNVPVVTIVDIPVAGGILALFFLWRRIRLSGTDTWVEDNSTVPKAVECTIGRGLYSKGHTDLYHAQLREASTFLITTAIFMSIPAAYSVFGTGVATGVTILQASAFLIAAGGMLVDRIFQWPNTSLVEGKHTYLACPQNCGCAMTAHGLWHLIAIVGAALTIAAREYALA